MYKPLFVFNFALVSPCGQYYTGKAGKEALSSNANDAYTYTEKGAYTKKDSSAFFRNFKIKQVS